MHRTGLARLGDFVVDLLVIPLAILIIPLAAAMRADRHARAENDGVGELYPYDDNDAGYDVDEVQS